MQATGVLHLAETDQNGGVGSADMVSIGKRGRGSGGYIGIVPAADSGDDLRNTLHLGLVTAIGPVVSAFGGVVKVALEGVVAVVEEVLHVVGDDTECVGGAVQHTTPPD